MGDEIVPTFCSKCGKQNTNKQNPYCSYCGHELNIAKEKIIEEKTLIIKIRLRIII